MIGRTYVESRQIIIESMSADQIMTIYVCLTLYLSLLRPTCFNVMRYILMNRRSAQSVIICQMIDASDKVNRIAINKKQCIAKICSEMSVLMVVS